MTSSLPHLVGVIGGGRMGGGIAHAFLMGGSNVVVLERDEASADAARERIVASIAKSLERGAAGDADEIGGRLAVATDRAALGDRDLVVEAVFEDPEVKREALQGAEAAMRPDAVLASNTSSMSIGALAEWLERPAQFVGLHFFNPVPASTLIEVVLGPATSEQLRADAADWVRGLGKTPIVVNDAPGFASSRLGVALALEAMRMVEQGVASAEDIDLAMELGYKHPTGPLRTTDIVGLDVRLGIAEYLHEHLGDTFAPPQILRDKVARGELGRKSGKGFYDYA